MASRALYDYLIIGGGVAGVTAAERIRELDTSGTIAILSREAEPLYSRVLLPQYVRGKLDRSKVFLRTLEAYGEKRIDLMLNEVAIAVNFETKEVTTSREKVLHFHKLLICTGGTPLPWDRPGADHATILRLQTIEDADKAREVLANNARQESPRAIIVGGGFIGFEFVESAVAYGYQAHVYLKEPHFFGDAIDAAGWAMLDPHFARHGVTIHGETEVRAVEDADGLIRALTNTSEKMIGNWLGLGIGIARNLAVFQGSGLEIMHGIKVNQYLEASIPNVWAAGDVAEYHDVISDEDRMVGNWTNAFLQGRIAGTNMAAKSPEGRSELRAVPSYSITNLGLHYTFVGKINAGDKVDAVTRVWPETKGYERLFFEGGKLVGAIIINRFQDKAAIVSLIESHKDLESIKEQIRGSQHDLKEIIGI